VKRLSKSLPAHNRISVGGVSILIKVFTLFLAGSVPDAECEHTRGEELFVV